MNQSEAIKKAACDAAKARFQGDESRAKFEADFAKSMIRLESDERSAMELFNSAYRNESKSLRGI